jgi:hypothetical protein
MTYTEKQIELALAMLGVNGGKGASQDEATTIAAAALEELATHFTLAPARPNGPGTAHDPVTGLVYDPADRADCRQVRTLNALYELFEARQPGISLLTHLPQEKCKEHGWALVLDSSLPLVARIGGAHAVIESHYARSASASLSCDDPLSFTWHPGYDEYAAHYLHASPEHWRESFGAAVFDALTVIYPAPLGAIRLAAGQTYWPAPSRSAVVV